jgi:hypothetical protein
MRTPCFALMVCAAATAWAQPGGIFFSAPGGGIVSAGGAPGGPQFSLRGEPRSSGLTRRFGVSMRSRGVLNGESFYSRYLSDIANHVYLGYELLIQQQQPGTYLLTFGKLGLTALEIAAQSHDSTEWTMQPLPAIPEPRVVHDGETISVDLFVDAATGEKLIDDIRIDPPRAAIRPATALPAAPVNRPIPTVAGNARDFSATDAELQIAQPRVTLNGTSQNSATRGAANVRGSLVWFYLPDHGRYVLSLAPRPDLDFKKAGEVRGGAITFTVGDDSIKLECPTAIATGGAPYYLYVLHDPEWEPTAQSQKGQFAAGSVDPGEIAALKRK